MELNVQQSKAVSHNNGPLLIIAGAGSGKTKVISERVVRLVNDGKALANEILALTFTDKAASEMRERIEQNLPISYEELFVKTFHSFCEQILRESGLEIGIDPGYKILSDVDQWFFFKKHLYEFDLDYYRPLGNPNKFIYELIGHFNKLRDELISPDEYLKYAVGLNESDEETKEEKRKMIEIAKVYNQYQERLLKNNFLDFGNLTFLAIELLKKRPSVLKQYQNRFKYVLVDEFQDTNFAQYQLVLLLSAGHKNLFVVGDDDQSIYKWRGASLSNILQFEKNFPGCEKVVLADNYRSKKEILDAAYSVIVNNNPDRLEVKIGLNKKLESFRGSGGKVCLHHFQSFTSEAEFVAKEIKQAHQSGTPYEEMAILIRTNALAHAFVEELKLQGIPYQIRSPKGLLALPEIKDLICVCKILANPFDDVAMLRLLKLDSLDIYMSEILELMKKAGHRSLFASMKEQSGASCGDNLSLPGVESGISRVEEILKSLIEFSKKKSVGLVLNEFLKLSGHLKYLIDGEKYEEIENINEFAKQVNKFEREHNENTVVDFVQYLDLLEEAGTSLSYDAFKDRQSVQILTIHGSKGLEFEKVFMVGLVKGRFPSINRRDTFEIPMELTKEIYPEGDFHVQEERRLFYVAMTRAKDDLYFTYSDFYEGSRNWKVSPFVNEALESGAVENFEHTDDEDAISKLQKLKQIEKPKLEVLPLKSKNLSYSQIDTFRTCPLQYNYKYVLKIPLQDSHTLSFGSSVHETLREFYQRLKTGKKVSVELMEELYEKSWQPFGYESVEQEKSKKEKGLEILKNFYEKNKNPWVIPAFLEKNFFLRVGEYAISGRIDRIDKLEDGTYEVIDYKTGRFKKTQNLKKDLQLSIYALAIKEVFGFTASKLSLYYLEDNVKVSTARSDEDMKNVAIEFEEMIGGMQKSDFMPTPGEMCNFCPFRLICPAV
ncbi:UvrD-helicase domain-containing protein [Candidatus Peregrinibacteria bacterium]|nr:UvrD-helicase domain-containing protein [Candidatus Peregrinibacteria bacterium]